MIEEMTGVIMIEEIVEMTEEAVAAETEAVVVVIIEAVAAIEVVVEEDKIETRN